MKRFLMVLALVSLASCKTDDTTSKVVTGTTLTSKASCNVLGVVDENYGKVYYDTAHPLYKHVNLQPKNGDKKFCSVKEAESAGFDKAPRYFADSTAKLLECIDDEGMSGACHSYVMGVFQSLVVYDRICAPRDIAPDRLIEALMSHVKSNPSQLEVDKFDGVSRAMLSKFSCSASKAAKPTAKKAKAAKKHK